MAGLFDTGFNKEDIEILNGNGIISSIKTTPIHEDKPYVPKVIPIDYKNRVSFTKSFENLEGYEDFEKEKYPLNFYDWEVFAADWMLTIINPVHKTMSVIVNDEAALKRYYNKHIDEVWIGYNSKNYDSNILKCTLLGMNPKVVSDEIIYNGKRAWQIHKDVNKVQLYDFDIFDGTHSLKQLEAFMGNDIRETEVDFNLERQLTRKEILQTAKYNKHDVEQTIEVFRRSRYKYDSQISLIETFEQPFSSISLTQQQLTARILECERVDGRKDDEFKFQILPTIRLNKYKYVMDWFCQPENRDYTQSLKTEVCGIPHTFGWGGLHGCIDEPVYRKGRIFHMDVTSYYPSLMIEYDLLTRNCKNKDKYKIIYDTRVALKKAGKKKEQAPYKIVLNGTYGICKDEHSSAYDPMQANAICVNGQLMLLDLLEHLEPYCQLIQSNTDGIIIQCDDNDDAVVNVMRVAEKWQKRTRMGLGSDSIKQIFQSDVNNYIFEFENGKYERKGGYVKELSELDNDLPIINTALVNFLMKGIPVEQTINECNDLIQFQKIVRVSSKYKYAWHNGEFLSEKTHRVFASNDFRDTYIGKCKTKNSTIEKFGDTPECCFIINEDIHGKWSNKVDKQWYITTAKNSLKKKFGIETSYGLF